MSCASFAGPICMVCMDLSLSSFVFSSVFIPTDLTFSLSDSPIS
jgi:hypothetical protein